MLRLVEPTSGEVRFRGEDVLAFSRARMRAARRDMQIVFQDPYSSLNPRMRARQIVEEPLIIHGSATAARAARAWPSCSRWSGSTPAHLERYPHEFSGGQRQRIGLARALALNPSFLDPRRAGLGARRLGAGAGREPADGPAAAVRRSPICSSRTICGSSSTSAAAWR